MHERLKRAAGFLALILIFTVTVRATGWLAGLMLGIVCASHCVHAYRLRELAIQVGYLKGKVKRVEELNRELDSFLGTVHGDDPRAG